MSVLALPVATKILERRVQNHYAKIEETNPEQIWREHKNKAVLIEQRWNSTSNKINDNELLI